MTEPEDIESKYLRVVAASLSALTLLLASIAKQHPEFVQEKYGELLQQGKFWKLAKHTNTQVSLCC